jgi:CheY-like chemotaxis protein
MEGPMRVLFVEDDPMNRRVIRDMLTVAGVEMTEAENAEVGLQMIGDDLFDLILMDLRMPGMDGLAAIKQIRGRADTKAQIPVVVITADTALNLRNECLGSGANDLILKPVVMDALFQTIGRLVAQGASDDTLLI